MSAELLIRLPDYFPSLINAMQDGFVLRGVDGTIIEVNEAFCRLVGLDRTAIVGSRPPHPWWPDDQRATFDALVARYLAGASSEDDLIYQRATGERFPAVVTNAPLRDSEGRIIAYISAVKDMTERVRAEERIRFQAALIDQVQAAVIATDAGGRITLWNRGAENLYGWTRNEALGQSGAMLLIGEESAEMAAIAAAAVRANGGWEGELNTRRKDGADVPVFVTSAPIFDRDGALAGLVGVTVDITERRRAEARIATLYEVARRLSDAQSLREGVLAALDAIGSGLDWSYGAFWTVDDVAGLARCEETWHAHGADGRAFEEICRSRPLEHGAGLPGSVWVSERPEWIVDYDDEHALPRQQEFLRMGIRSAIALPVRLDGVIAGVIEFFAESPRTADPRLLEAAETIGSQIGQFIERKRAESALRESESRFRAMADSAPVLLWVAGPDARGAWFNRGWLDFTGRTVEQETGNGWIEGVHPDDRPARLDAYLTAFNAREPFETEYRLRRHDGEHRWLFERATPRVEPDGAFAGYIGSCVDISDRKRDEERQAFLSEATALLASSLDYRHTLASVANLAVPRIADWCVVHAVDDDGAIGQLVVAHADPAKLDWVREIQERYPTDMNAPGGVPRVIRTGEPEVYPEISDELLVMSARDEEHLRLLREVGFTSAMFVPIVARERVLGVISFISAETGRRYDAEDLAIAQHLARRSAVAIDNALLYREARDAARARDQFLAVAAHELRSPLTSMKGFAQLLLRRAQRVEGGAEWITPLRTIDTQVNRVSELVSRLLDVSRIEEQRLQLQVEPVDMVEVVRSAAVEAQLATEQHVVVARFAEDALVAIVDRTRIEQVLANLLDNAIKHSPPGGSIEVTLVPDGEALVVSVADQGPGIPLETRERLFERYFRGASSTRAASEGLGLGLYVAHGIVDAHGGRMWVESEVGRGSTFCFRLPRGEVVEE